MVLKERRNLILCIRESPLSGIDLENCLRLARWGVTIVPLSPPFYFGSKKIDDLVIPMVDKILRLAGQEIGEGWRGDELE